eukprot:scaffold18140_cov28-Attheya_sp.AAC.2
MSITMNLSPEKIKIYAAGTITSTKDAIEWNDKVHTVAQWLLGDEQHRKSLLMSHNVCGIAFVTADHKIKFLHGIQLHSSIVETGQIQTSYIIGQVGNQTTVPAPSSLPLEDVLKDFLSYKDIDPTTPSTWTKTSSNKLQDWTPKEGESTLQLPANGTNTYLGRFPVVIPLVYGHMLKTGSLTNPLVLREVVNYHPAMRDWIDVISLQVISTRPLPDLQHLGEGFLPRIPAGIQLAVDGFPTNNPVSLNIEDEDDKERYKLVLQQMDQLRLTNEAKYFTKNPAHLLEIIRPNGGAILPAQGGPAHMGGDEDMGPQSHSQQSNNPQESSSKKAFDDAKIFLMLEGACLEKDENGVPVVVYPEITEDWEELYDITHVAQLGSAISGLFIAASEDREDNTHYLDRAIDLPQFSQLAAKSLIQVISKRTPLDENGAHRKNEISILNMLPPPKIKGSETKTAYDNYCESTQQQTLSTKVRTCKPKWAPTFS